MWYWLIVNNENLTMSSSQIYSTTNLQNWSLSSISFPKTTSIDSNICSADLGCCHISPNKEYSSHAIFIWYQKALNAWTLVISFLIPHSVANEHRWLVKAPRWIKCPGCLGQAVVTLWLPCAIVESSQRHRHVPFVNIASLRSRSIKRRQWKHKLNY